ncbi:hypothetical protein DD563_00015 [Pelagicola sp. LXJ1103]|nr:hypothetical protein DD563_00015 [Pelagicola sp. LXJ1103]
MDMKLPRNHFPAMMNTGCIISTLLVLLLTFEDRFSMPKKTAHCSTIRSGRSDLRNNEKFGQNPFVSALPT